MIEHTYPLPDQPSDFLDFIDVRDVQDTINMTPRTAAFVEPDGIRLLRDADTTIEELDAIYAECIRRTQLLKVAKESRQPETTARQHFDDVIASVQTNHGEPLKIARAIASSAFWSAFDKDLDDVTEWCAHKHRIRELLIEIELHMSRGHYCDLALCNAFYVKPRELRVAVRDDAKLAMESLGYRFDFRPGADIAHQSLSSRSDRMSGHERLRAIKRLEDR